jgi:hypothetical protein
MTFGAFFKTYWRDILNVVGFTGTVVSLWLTYRQSRMARTAAEAAEAAAIRAALEGREAFRRHSVSSAVRVLEDIKQHVSTASWLALTLRLSDLAGHLSQLRDSSGKSQTFCVEARQWELTFRRMYAGGKNYPRTKWDGFLGRLQAMLDDLHGPFHETEG